MGNASRGSSAERARQDRLERARVASSARRVGAGGSCDIRRVSRGGAGAHNVEVSTPANDVKGVNDRTHGTLGFCR